MLHVLFVAPRFPPDVPSGWSTAFARLVAQVARHARVRLVAGYRRDRSLVPPDALGVDLRRRGSAARWLELWRATREVVRAERPDLVVVAGLGLPPVGCPVVAVARDLTGEGWRRLQVGLAARLMARVPRTVVVPSQGVRRQVRALGVGAWRVERLPIGIDVPDGPAPWPRDARRLLVHPGTIHPARGQHLSVDAVSRLPPEVRSRVHLVVAGPVADDRYLAQLRIAAADQPITLAANVPDLGREIARAHLALYPTAIEEGFPDPAVTAMAQGRAVVWPDLPVMREVLRHEGFRVRPHSVEAVRDAVIAAVADPGLEAAGRRAFVAATRMYGWPALWPRWRMLLDHAAVSRACAAVPTIRRSPRTPPARRAAG